MTPKPIQHSILFTVFWASILYAEISNPEYKLVLLILAPLFFLVFHLKYFTKNFLNEILFISISFSIGFISEYLLSNLGAYHFGLVDTPGLTWPPPWVTALWMTFPIYLCTSLQVLNRMRIFGAYLGAILAYSIYSLLGERLDLIFFHAPQMQSAVFFILTWYLIIRALFLLHAKISLFKLN